ncbi:unnamed protein product [Caretta caretta]
MAFHILEDITVLVVPYWRRKILFQAAGGKSAVYTSEVFKCIVTKQHICEWNGLVRYTDELGKYALPCKML